MRTDPPEFASANEAPAKSPRYVCAIIFDAGSIYVTSHTTLSNVPGTVISGALVRPSAVSQRIRPEDGRAEIGSLSFELIDRAGAFTNAARDLLENSNLGLRGKTVRFYVGYDDDFDNFQLFQTQIVQSAEYDAGVYTIACQDIQRQTRETIFEPKVTNLRDSVSATDTTIPVYTTTGFDLVLHGTSWSDSPSSSVGYIQVEQEIIRYTGKTADSFTGCTRGVLNTRAAPHTVDASTAEDRRAKVSEVVYLELPAVKLAYAILTGQLYGDSASLPPHWHLGISTSLVRVGDFTGIGTDLWDPAADAAGLVLRFVQPGRQDGKRFLETEVLQLAACYMPVYSTGELGLRRLEPILRDAPAVALLTEDTVTSLGPLQHDMKSMFNRLRVDWNWNGNEFTRSTQLVDATSVARHGASDIKTVKYRGLFGNRHTDSIIAERLNSLRDRFAAPPERISVGVLPSLNRLEVGDIVRLKIANLRDYAGPAGGIERSFEVQAVTVDFTSGDVRLELFGSTDRAGAEPIGEDEALPDAYYTSQGVALSTVCTIVDVGGVGVIQAGTYNLAGNANLNAAGAIYYHDGDLELSSGATLTVNNNVQIRVRGFFTINGQIDGVGRGQAGVASSGTLSVNSSAVMTNDVNPGLAGYVGNSRGMDGVFRFTQPVTGSRLFTVPAAQTLGRHASAPLLSLAVSGNSLVGLPDDLRGTSGGGGGKARSGSGTIFQGGTGGDSGAGLVIVCRGLAFGASGEIDLSGDSPAATSLVDLGGPDGYPGPGGAGGPGTLYLLLDGSTLSVPDLGGKFLATTGTVPVNGNPLPEPRQPIAQALEPFAGWLDPAFVQSQDLSNAAHRIQYIPAPETPEEDSDALPPAPTSISASGQVGFILVSLGLPPTDQFDVVEVWASIDNDRTNATKVGEGLFDSFVHTLPGGALRYYWTRTKRTTPAGVLLSAWYPATTTTTASATATSPSTGPAGDSVQIEYSVDGATNWHATFATGDLYMRQRVGTGGAWSAAIRIVGEQGSPGTAGNFIDYVFRRAATQPATPTGDNPAGWSDAPPADDGNPLWFSAAEKTAAGVLVGSWSTPVRISGNDGNDGNDGANAVTSAVIPSGPTAWVRAVDQTTWAPTTTSVDLDCTFYQAGAAVARRAWRITRAADGTLTGATTTHVDGDLNTTRVTVTEINEGTLAMGVRFAYSYDGDTASVTQTVTSTLSGTNGNNGADGLSVAELTVYRRSSTAPATPTGGSFNFGTQTLTPPASWSVSVPAGTDPVYVSTTVAAITGASGTDSTLTWSAPVLAFQNGTNGTNGTDGQAVDMVFQRAATQPATPSASAGVPAGWYTDVASVPASSNPLWSSVGTRPNPSTNWTWQTPIRVEGIDGDDGAPGSPGAPGLTLALSLTSFSVRCDAAGVPLSGAFDQAVGQVTLYSGTTDVTASATFSSTTSSVTGSVNTATNVPVTGARGSYRITAMNANTGYLEITATYNGVSVRGRLTVQKVLAGTAASSQVDTSLTINNTASYTGQQGGPLVLPVGPVGTITVSVNHGYLASGSSGYLAGKVQYRTTPGSGGWVDFHTEVQDAFGSLPGEPSALTYTRTLAGPATAANWEFQYVNRRYSGAGTLSNNGSQNFTVQWGP